MKTGVQVQSWISLGIVLLQYLSVESQQLNSSYYYLVGRGEGEPAVGSPAARIGELQEIFKSQTRRMWAKISKY